jgi:hypothetical protein
MYGGVHAPRVTRRVAKFIWGWMISTNKESVACCLAAAVFTRKRNLLGTPAQKTDLNSQCTDSKLGTRPTPTTHPSTVGATHTGPSPSTSPNQGGKLTTVYHTQQANTGAIPNHACSNQPTNPTPDEPHHAARQPTGPWRLDQQTQATGHHIQLRRRTSATPLSPTRRTQQNLLKVHGEATGQQGCSTVCAR